MNLEQILQQCEWLEMSPQVIQAVVQTFQASHDDPQFNQLFQQGYRELFVPGDTAQVREWQPINELPPPWGKMFYPLLLLYGMPVVRERHRQLGIDETITRDTLSDLELWMYEYRKQHGVWGLDVMRWLWRHFTSQIFKLGRLQFEFSHFPLDFHVWQHGGTGEVMSLAGEGMKFRRDGQFDGANGIHDTAVWTANYQVEDEAVVGSSISLRGNAEQLSRELPRDEWKLVLEQGTPALDIHIPAIGPMDHEVCLASYRQALEFFPRHFPEFQFKAFVCTSWLLDSQLAEYLPASSNIVQFQRDYYLLPVPDASDFQTWERVFGSKPASLDDVTPNTSLQRAVLQHARVGRHWRKGHGFILRDDMVRDRQIISLDNQEQRCRDYIK